MLQPNLLSIPQGLEPEDCRMAWESGLHLEQLFNLSRSKKVCFKRFEQLWQQPVLSTITGILKVNYVITELQKSFEAAEYSTLIKTCH